MTSSAEYQSRIATFDRDDLLRLWGAVETGGTPGWEPGRAMEYLVLRAFEIEGAEVRWPFDVGGIEQLDGAVYVAGLACLVECKDLREPVDVEPIAKLRNQLMRRPATALGLLFSRSGFTQPARILAGYVAPQVILLWEGREVAAALRQQRMCEGLVRKYRHCVETGNVDFNIVGGENP